ncbi:hypothetical protein WA158_000537 [Blastocystis sp. Blastoise]
MDTKPLTVKVMRLVKPFYESSNLDSVEGLVLPGYDSLFSLPQSFGTIYLGQRFSAYISVINKSGYDIKNMDVTVELKSQSQKYILPDDQYNYQKRYDISAPYPKVRDIPNGKHYNMIIQKPILELGEHCISVLISYIDPVTLKTENMKKNFKFFVEKPIDITINNISLTNCDQLVHIIIDNVTKQTLTIKKISFKPLEGVVIDDVQKTEDDNLSKIGPDVSYSTIYKAKCADITAGMLPQEIGYIHILWSDESGEEGYLQTSTITSEITDQSPIFVSYMHIPPSAPLLKPITLDFNINNITSNTYTITIDWTNIQDYIRIIGQSSHTLLIKDHDNVNIPIQFLPISAGEFKMMAPTIKVTKENGEKVPFTFNSAYMLIEE